MATGEDLGRGPEWNDDGLPEVDVEIPDDIRELDREVQAYRREQRRERRQRALRRLLPGAHRLGPYGVLAPVVAGALVVTALFGVVLSLLGPQATAPPTDREATGPPPSEENLGGPLPEVSVEVDGERTRLSTVRSAVVVTVPSDCRCDRDVAALTSTARATGVGVYLSGRHDQVEELADRAGRYPHVLDHADTALKERYHPDGLTAVLVDQRGNVTDVVDGLERGTSLRERQLRGLATPSP